MLYFQINYLTSAQLRTLMTKVTSVLRLLYKLVIYDRNGIGVGTVLEKVMTLLPKFEMYKNNEYMGCLSKELFYYNIDYNGWHIDGSLAEWDYTIVDKNYDTVAVICKQIFNVTDTYVIDVKNPDNALDALMFVLAIDAEKCSRNK